MSIIETAEAHRTEAARHEERARQSFEDIGTDGALSQWAGGILADRERMSARLAESEGLDEFTALFDLDGNIISTHSGYGQYGPWFRLEDEAAERYGRRFISPSRAQKIETRRANNRKKGVTEGLILAPAYASTRGSGRGLAGALTVQATVKPVVSALKAGEFEVITAEA